MTYFVLLPTTTDSELPGALNGVTTRRQKLVFDTGSSGSTAADGITGSIQAWSFATGELLFANWPLPDRLDRAVNMTLQLIGAPATSEGSKEVSFDVKILSIDDTAGTLIDGTTATVQIVDESVSATAFTAAEITATLTAATFLGSAVDTLGIRITRVAASADLAGEWRLVSAVIQYTIER